MSEFSRETLLNIIETDHVQCGDASALARITLAALDSEPVAYMLDCVGGTDYSNHPERGGIPLYRHAQPVPVVPDEVTAEDCPALVKYDVTEVDEAWARGFNACRAAMLQASPVCTCPSGDGSLRWPCPVHPGNNPEIPDAWIPVSEQMPEIGDIVLTSMGGAVNVGEMECSAANFRFFTSVISGRELPATHWMPLPAAPQEVKGE